MVAQTTSFELSLHMHTERVLVNECLRSAWSWAHLGDSVEKRLQPTDVDLAVAVEEHEEVPSSFQGPQDARSDETCGVRQASGNASLLIGLETTDWRKETLVLYVSETLKQSE